MQYTKRCPKMLHFARPVHSQCRRFGSAVKETLDAHKFTKLWRIETGNFARGFSMVGMFASMISFYYETRENEEGSNETMYELSASIPTLERSFFIVGIWTLGALSRSMFVTTRNAIPLLHSFVNTPLLSGAKFGLEAGMWSLGYGCCVVSLMSMGLDLRYRYNFSESWNLTESADDSVINLGNAATMGATTGNPSASHGSAENFTEIMPDSFEDSETPRGMDEDEVSFREGSMVEETVAERIDFDFTDLLERSGEAMRGFLKGHGPVFMICGCMSGAGMVRVSWARWKMLLDRCRIAGMTPANASAAGSVVKL